MSSKKTKGLDIAGLTGGMLDLGSLTGAVSLGAGPDLAALAAGPQEPIPDPLADTAYSGDLAADVGVELTDLQVAYRDPAKNEAKRFKNATDSEYWFAVCFRDRASKEKFLKDYGLIALGDKYIDGHRAGKLLAKPKKK